MANSIYATKEVLANISAANPTYCSFCSAAGQVMICYDNSDEWTLQGSGYIDLCKNQNQNLYINLYSAENYIILYQYQLYPNFSDHFKKLSDTFYKFETNEDYLIGLSFSSAEEAQNFETAVITHSKLVKKKIFSKNQKEPTKSPRSSLIMTSGIESPLNNSLEARGFSKEDITNGKIDKNTLMEIISEADNHADQQSPQSGPPNFCTPQKKKKNAITDKIKFFNSFDVDKQNNIISGKIEPPNQNTNSKNDNNNNADNKDLLINNNDDQSEPQIKLNNKGNNDSLSIDNASSTNNINKSDGAITKLPKTQPARYSRAQRGRSNSTVVMKNGQFYINECQVKPPPIVKPPPPDTPPPITARRIPRIDAFKSKSNQIYPLPVRQSPLVKDNENVS